MKHSLFFRPDVCVEPGVKVHIWSAPSPPWEMSRFLWVPEDRLLEAHSVGELVIVELQLRTPHLLFAILFAKAFSARPKWERKSPRACERKQENS